MSDTSKPEKYRPPQAVLDNAQAALAQLAQEDAALATRVAKILPGYAVRLHQRGEDTGVDALITVARMGADALKDIFQQKSAPKSFIEQYTAIAATFLPPVQNKKPAGNAYLIYDAKADVFTNRTPTIGWNAGGFNDGFRREEIIYDRYDVARPRDLAHFEMRQDHYARRNRHEREIDSYRNMMRALHLPEHAMRADALNFQLRYPQYNAHHIIATALQMGRIRLVGELLPAVLNNMHGHEAHFINSLLDYLPHTADVLIKLAQHAPARVVMRTMLTVLCHENAPETLLHHAVKTIAALPPDVRAQELGTHLSKILQLRPQLARPVLEDIINTDPSRFADRRLLQAFGAYAPEDVFEDVMQSLLVRKVNWDQGFIPLTSEVAAHRILRLGAMADIEAPDWRKNVSATDLRNSSNQMPRDPAAFAALLEVLGADVVHILLSQLIIHTGQQSDATARAAMTQSILNHTGCTNEGLYYALRSVFSSRNNMDARQYLDALDLAALQSEQRLSLLLDAPVHMVQPLLEKGSFTKAELDQKLRSTTMNMGYDTQSAAAYQLICHGGDVELISATQRNLYATHAADYDRWMRIARVMPPERLRQYSAQGFKPDLFNDIKAALQREAYTGGESNIYAYNAALLLQSPERVLQYLQKWGTPGRQPLHNLVQVMALPTNLGEMNLNDWGDAILRHGPDMAKLAKFGASIPSPARGDDGGWSLSKTRAIAATFTYPRGHEHPVLAALCNKHNVREDAFNKALDLVQARGSDIKKDIPELNIDGARFDMPGARFHKLADDDVRGLFLGELTDCCQSIGGVGAKCAEHGYTSPNAGFYVIETEKGEVIGQTWAWRGDKNELVFDSLEMLGGRVSASQWKMLMDNVVNDISKKRGHKISALHVGTSGETPSSFAQHFNKAATAAKPRDYNGYRDSNAQYVIWQKPETKYARKPK